MFYKLTKISFLFIALAFVGCSKTEDQVFKEAEEVVNGIFSEENKVEINYSDDIVSFYLPEHLHIVEQDENNLVLKNGDHVYVIFMNYMEASTSKVFFGSAQADDALLYTSYERDDMFGYMRILENLDDKGTYELQVGIGGVKVTTNTTLKQLVSESEQLMKIAKSIIEANF